MNTDLYADILWHLNDEDLRGVAEILGDNDVSYNYTPHDNGALTVDGFGKLRWDDQDPDAAGWVVHSLDYDGGVEYDAWPVDAGSLALQLAELVAMVQSAA